MRARKRTIGIIIYSNPDYYPIVINTIYFLAKEFDLLVICRNTNKPLAAYPSNVTLHRLGRLETEREKEGQGALGKFWEYIAFTIYTIFYIRYYRCRFIYSYDMYGFISGFLAGRLGKKIPLLYHNFDVYELERKLGLSRAIKYLELRLARYAGRIVFPDINRAKFFQGEAKLQKTPDIVMNTPLRMDHLPADRLKDILTAKGFAMDTKAVIYQGSISDSHSILEVIRSMAFWPKNAILVLLGEAPDEFLKMVYNIARGINLDNRILHIPMVPYSELFYYTICAHIGLALYKPIDINQIFNAGASNKLFEYISLGIPVVTNDSPYFREVIDSSVAYFARPDSAEDIARAVNSAFSNIEEYSRKRQAARQLHLTKFNYQEQFRPIIEFIRGAAEKEGHLTG